MTQAVICPYCDMPSMRMTGRELHPARLDLANNHYHVCRNCDAWIGCREGTWEPTGRLADASLRRAKQDVHAALEPVWQDAVAAFGWPQSKARNLAYRWLASEMALPGGHFNIGEFDLKQCHLVSLICAHREADLSALAGPNTPTAAQSRGRPPFQYRNPR